MYILVEKAAGYDARRTTYYARSGATGYGNCSCLISVLGKYEASKNKDLLAGVLKDSSCVKFRERQKPYASQLGLFIGFKKTLVNDKQNVYHYGMIRSFANSETKQFFATGKSRRLPSDIIKRAAMRLTQLDGATCIDDLRIPPSNRLETLSQNRIGQWSIRINDQWRVCFRFDNGDAYDVEIIDYH